MPQRRWISPPPPRPKERSICLENPSGAHKTIGEVVCAWKTGGQHLWRTDHDFWIDHLRSRSITPRPSWQNSTALMVPTNGRKDSGRIGRMPRIISTSLNAHVNHAIVDASAWYHPTTAPPLWPAVRFPHAGHGKPPFYKFLTSENVMRFRQNVDVIDKTPKMDIVKTCTELSRRCDKCSAPFWRLPAAEKLTRITDK